MGITNLNLPGNNDEATDGLTNGKHKHKQSKVYSFQENIIKYCLITQ